MSNLLLRIFTAVVLAPLALYCVIWGGWPFLLFTMLAGVGIFSEWISLSKTHYTKLSKRISWVFYVIFLVLLCLWPHYALLFLFLAGSVLIWYSNKSWLWVGLGFFYSSLPAFALVALRTDYSCGLLLILFLLTIVWSTDIGAYFVGRFFGGPKLAPHFSPNKTWSGAMGGVVSAVIFSCLLFYYWPGEQTYGALAGALAVLLSVTSQIGDIVESAVKRHFGVKDSGWVLPGHGGVMDRLDGLIFAAFAFYIILQINIGTKPMVNFLIMDCDR